MSRLPPPYRTALVAALTALLALPVLGQTTASSSATGTARVATLPAPHLKAAGLVQFLVVKGRSVRFTVAPSRPDGEVDEVEEARSFDVRIRRARMRAARPPAWRLRSTGETRLTHRLRVGAGRIVCLRVRQHSFGLRSAWSAPNCVVRPLDDSRLRRQGRVTTVRDRHYPDHRARVLHRDGRLLLPRVPRRAWYAAVQTNVRRAGHRWPDIRILGHRASTDCSGGYRGRVVWCARRTTHAGTAVVSVRGRASNPVGGVVVLPKWMLRK